jgi:anaerobic selenocysteine-containing dehydrogenase
MGRTTMANLDRRNFLKLSASTLVGMTLGGTALHALAQEHVKTDDPLAVAMRYVEKSTVEGANCANCIQGKDGDAYRACNIFPGKLVNAEGWCAAWAKKG